MPAVHLLGMIWRETFGIDRTGFESTLMLTVYAIAISIVRAPTSSSNRVQLTLLLELVN